MKETLILASASPRRQELLQQIGVSFRVRPVDLDESMLAGESPLAHVQRLARQKAQAGADSLGADETELPVLGADTIVELEGEVMGKPQDAEHAKAMLAKLSGKTHRVHTAVCIHCGNDCHQAMSSTAVSFDSIDAAAIDAYVATGEPLGKAGAYAIQGHAAQFVKSLQGSYSGVVGLPLYETAQMLSAAGIRIL